MWTENGPLMIEYTMSITQPMDRDTNPGTQSHYIIKTAIGSALKIGSTKIFFLRI